MTVVAGGLRRTTMDGYNGSNYHPVRIDSATRALQTIEYEHHEIHDGNHFFVQYAVADIGAMTTPNDMITLSFTTSNTTKWMHMHCSAAGADGARFRFIEGKTGGGADPTGSITVLNSDRNSATTSLCYDLAGTPVINKVSYDATLFTGGTTMFDTYVGADGIGGGTVAGGFKTSNELILKQNTAYQLSLFETGNVPGEIIMSWYEHTNKDA